VHIKETNQQTQGKGETKGKKYNKRKINKDGNEIIKKKRQMKQK
jgi:hypothetical protein